MKVWEYLITLEDGAQVTLIHYAYTETEAVAPIYRMYPNWASIELTNSYYVGRKK